MEFKPKVLENNRIPNVLHEIPEPPEKLWYVGELPPRDSTYLCVVGSRKFTTYGKDACERIIMGLRGYPIVIVSGLALGIDAIAHRTALASGLKALVFPGSGLSREALYPRSHLKLAEEIVASGGCLMSEFEPSFRSALWGFVKRNRLMAGISKAVLIIEAAERSGTLVTARLATEYNRDVLAVPGSIFSPVSKGTNKLIRLGATPVTSSDDVLEALGFKIDETTKFKTLFDDASREEKLVLEILAEPLPRDELIRAMKMSVAEANSLLSIMEIKGLIKEELGEIRAAF